MKFICIVEIKNDTSNSEMEAIMEVEEDVVAAQNNI